MGNILKDQINLRKTAPGTYTISWNEDWKVGPALHGGSIAAAIHHAATTYLVTDPLVAPRRQPDIMTMHIEFLRPCKLSGSLITIVPLKVGAGTSTLQIELSQDGRTNVIALATATNFDKPVGPSAQSEWILTPPPPPKPNFDSIQANKPDSNWVPARIAGELIPFTGRILNLSPRGGFLVNGICDAWNRFLGDERMDATYLALMSDVIPSMSDTLLRNGATGDAHTFNNQVERLADQSPGVPAAMSNTVAEALKAGVFQSTVTLDIEFKRRLPKNGLRWLFTRTSVKMLLDGRMDNEMIMCNEDMEIVSVAHQLNLVLESQRRFRSKTQSVL